MKKLMFAFVSALAFAAVADEGGPQAECQRRAPRDRAAMQGRAMMPRGEMGAMTGDPAVRAVANPKVAEQLGLSQEVRDQIKRLERENRDKVRDLQAKTRVAVESQAKLMKAEKLDEAAVMAAIDEVFDCRKEMVKANVRHAIAVKALLTPEQLAKAVEAMKTLREARRGNRGQQHGGKPEGGPEGAPEGRPGDAPEGAPEGNPPPPPAQ